MININDIRNNKKKLACLTAYNYHFAKILDKYCDILLVGDSVGMVVYGMESTIGVSLDMMINHGKAVVKARENAFVVVDMPFGSYQKSPEQAFENACRILKETGCDAVKLESPIAMVDNVRFLVDRAVPVMGHIGLMPQWINQYGNYKQRGSNENEAGILLKNAKLLEEAGCFAIVLENIPDTLAVRISEEIAIPTIGIGAGLGCDGQIMVTEDMIGLSGDRVPKFVTRYCDLSEEIEKAVIEYKNSFVR